MELIEACAAAGVWTLPHAALLRCRESPARRACRASECIDRNREACRVRIRNACGHDLARIRAMVWHVNSTDRVVRSNPQGECAKAVHDHCEFQCECAAAARTDAGDVTLDGKPPLGRGSSPERRRCLRAHGDFRSQPPENPAARKPLTRYGDWRVSRHNSSLR